eukprot:GEMP01009300.1.p1 GENE.GEMP01009300.1~~GEMP01009300.1.p1  ORF type:complete len:559 (+),score=114.32 GEMP01009300.1:74-1678(+)
MAQVSGRFLTPLPDRYYHFAEPDSPRTEVFCPRLSNASTLSREALCLPHENSKKKSNDRASTSSLTASQAVPRLPAVFLGSREQDIDLLWYAGSTLQLNVGSDHYKMQSGSQLQKSTTSHANGLGNRKRSKKTKKEKKIRRKKVPVENDNDALNGDALHGGDAELSDGDMPCEDPDSNSGNDGNSGGEAFKGNHVARTAVGNSAPPSYLPSISACLNVSRIPPSLPVAHDTAANARSDESDEGRNMLQCKCDAIETSGRGGDIEDSAQGDGAGIVSRWRAAWGTAAEYGSFDADDACADAGRSKTLSSDDSDRALTEVFGSPPKVLPNAFGKDCLLSEENGSSLRPLLRYASPQRSNHHMSRSNMDRKLSPSEFAAYGFAEGDAVQHPAKEPRMMAGSPAFEGQCLESEKLRRPQSQGATLNVWDATLGNCPNALKTGTATNVDVTALIKSNSCTRFNVRRRIYLDNAGNARCRRESPSRKTHWAIACTPFLRDQKESTAFRKMKSELGGDIPTICPSNWVWTTQTRISINDRI